MIDTAARNVSLKGKPVELTAREYALVEFLALHRGEVVTRTQLYEHLFDENESSLSNLLDVHVSNIRKKLGAEFIVTRRGHGYCIEVIMFFKSIHWRLQIWYGLILVAVLAGFGLTAYQLERNRRMRAIDDELHQRMETLSRALHLNAPANSAEGRDGPPEPSFEEMSRPLPGNPDDEGPPPENDMRPDVPLRQFRSRRRTRSIFAATDRAHIIISSAAVAAAS